jgi:hypothetical protein
MSAIGGKADIGQIGRSLAPSTCIDEVLTRLPHQRIFASDRYWITLMRKTRNAGSTLG